MEYLRFHDEYDDLPLDEIMASYAKHYSGALYEAPRGDFDRDVEEETRVDVEVVTPLRLGQRSRGPTILFPVGVSMTCSNMAEEVERIVDERQ